MGTSRIILPITTDGGVMMLPTANPAAVTKVTSSAVATANTPKPTYNRLDFDQTTDQFAEWMFELPPDYLSGGALFIKVGAAVNTGNIIMGGGIAPATDNSTLVPAGVFNACDVSATVAVPGTIGQVMGLSWALTMTGALANRLMSVFLSRRASAAADTAGGLAHVLSARLDYTT